MRIVIKHLSGSEEGRRDYFPSGRIVIGRDDGCDVSFDRQLDLEVSGRHSEIIAEKAGEFRIVDLGSTNGTWLNGTEIQDSVLAPGDEIELGPGGPRLKFELAKGFWWRLMGRLFGRARSARK